VVVAALQQERSLATATATVLLPLLAAALALAEVGVEQRPGGLDAQGEDALLVDDGMEGAAAGVHGQIVSPGR
jgi:hypothetical protein